MPGDVRVADLLHAADVVIETGELDPDALRAGRPELVVVSISPFGRTGPLAGRPATDFTVQAECGSIAGRGVPELPPVQAGGRTSEWAAGLYGAVAGLAAVLGVRGGADGTVVDASWMEAMTLCTNLFADPMWSIMRALMGIEPPGDPRSVETPSIYPTADGWIGFNTNGPQHAEAFLRLIERDDLIEAGYVSAQVRVGNRHEFDGWVRDWTTSLTSAEILERAAALRVPTARVNDAASVLDEEQLVAREFYVPSVDGRLRVPRPHYRIDGQRPPLAGPAPALDEAAAEVADLTAEREARAATARRRATSASAPSATRPLEGLKVLDITSWWAGPSNTQLLAALGADVIHVESIAHPDPMRYAAAVAFIDRERWWELSSFYICINTNKRGITLDLGRPEGVALAERLIGWADVVVENYTPRVMPKFGLDWPTGARAEPGGGHGAPARVRPRRAVGRAPRLRPEHGADVRHGLPHRPRRRGAPRAPRAVRPARRGPRRVRHARRPRPSGRHRCRVAGRGAADRGRPQRHRRAGRRVLRHRSGDGPRRQPLRPRRAPGPLRLRGRRARSPCRSRPTPSGPRWPSCSARTPWPGSPPTVSSAPSPAGAATTTASTP